MSASATSTSNLVVTEPVAFSCCASPRFAARLAQGSPYAGWNALVEHARRVWWQECGVGEWLAALAAHPKIGRRKEVAAHNPGDAAFASFSASEQAAAAATTSDGVAAELERWNEAYADKFGFIFIICARGRSSPDILAELRRRFHRLPHEELQTAAAEQMKITELRLGTALGLDTPDAARTAQRRVDQVLAQVAAAHTGAPLQSPITTHVLDTAMGSPAQGLALRLLKLDVASRGWDTVASGTTNADGRVPGLLPPASTIEPGRYRMFFDTASYLTACRQRHPGYYAAIPFYPEVTIDFEIAPDKAGEHYHIPLLLSPYGYSTYRGS